MFKNKTTGSILGPKMSSKSLNIAYISSLHSQYFRNTLYIGLNKLDVSVDLYPTHKILSPTRVHPVYSTLMEDIRILKNKLSSYDYIVVSPRNDLEQIYLNRIIKSIEKYEIPLVIVDIGDILEYRPVLFSKKLIKYFKREFIPPTYRKVPHHHRVRSVLNSVAISCRAYWNNPLFAPILSFQTYDPKIAPFFLGITDIKRMLNFNIDNSCKHKPIDVSFIARLNNPLRRQISNKLVELKNKYDLNIVVGSGFSLSEYYKIISLSKISISVPGIGFDTFRYYEIPYFSTALVSFRLPIQIPDNFENWKSAVFFDEPDEIEDIILKLLATKKWKRIGHAGYRKIMKNFIDIKVAEYFLEKLEKR